MLDPMLPPEATLLLAITPSFVGVVLALIAVAAIALAGILRELGGPRPRRQAVAAPAARYPLPLRAG
jgi:hypothetical protein